LLTPAQLEADSFGAARSAVSLDRVSRRFGRAVNRWLPDLGVRDLCLLDPPFNYAGDVSKIGGQRLDEVSVVEGASRATTNRILGNAIDAPAAHLLSSSSWQPPAV
jgi:hypothetical protein